MMRFSSVALELDRGIDEPPVGTPESALLCVLSCGERFDVLAHTGRYFHGMIDCGGYQGEEIGIDDVPTDEPGFWVFERGRSYTEYTEGMPDGGRICGDWRPATLKDFENFDVPLPRGLVGVVMPELARSE